MIPSPPAHPERGTPEGRGIVLSLCDRTGNIVRPWAEAGYQCVCVDLQHAGTRSDGNITFVGADVTDYLPPRAEYRIAFAFPPCTDLANSGNRWKADKGLARLSKAIGIVSACRRLLEWTGAPHMLENPVGSLSTYWRKPDYTCHPWHFGEHEQKLTCLWTGGGFVHPHKVITTKPDGVKQSCWLAGPSADRGDIRSVTPEAFALAVFEANQQRNHNGRPELPQRAVGGIDAHPSGDHATDPGHGLFVGIGDGESRDRVAPAIDDQITHTGGPSSGIRAAV